MEGETRHDEQTEQAAAVVGVDGVVAEWFKDMRDMLSIKLL